MFRFFSLTSTLFLFTLLGVDAADQEKPKELPPAAQKLLKGTPEEFIKQFDKTGDGFLSKDEMPPRLADFFEKIDSNGDGKLDKKEIEQMMEVLRKRYGLDAPGKPKTETASEKRAPEPPRIPDFDALDRNADGRLTREELKGHPLLEVFDQIDANKDGKITRQELEAYFKKLAEKEKKE